MRTASRIATLLVATTALLAGCAGADQASTRPDTGSAPAAGGGAFPVTIPHAYGETTIESEPQRVVTIGFNEADFALALGVVPVGVRDFFGEYDETQRPWAQEQLGGQTPTDVGGTELNIEAVAALEPDLILGVYSFIDENTYETLSAIAPTIAPPDETVPATWQEQTLTAGLALGRTAEAEQAVADAEQAFADARAAYPQFEGRDVAVDLLLDGGVHYDLGADDLRTQPFADLGIVIPEASTELGGETLPQLDREAIVVLGSEEDLAGEPVWQTLAAVREGRVVYIPYDTELAGALGFGSVLSLPYALDLLTPQLAEVLPA